jgi:hypothetical protein
MSPFWKARRVTTSRKMSATQEVGIRRVLAWIVTDAADAQHEDHA